MLSLRSRRFAPLGQRRRIVVAAIVSAFALVSGCALLTRALGGTSGLFTPSHMSWSPSAVSGTSGNDIAARKTSLVETSKMDNQSPVLPTTGVHATSAIDLGQQGPAIHPTSGKPVRAEIITCPACRLNSLPRVKRFVKEEAKLYEPALKVNYIFGEDPTLHLYEDGKEVKVIDLAPLDGEQIGRILVDFGIHPRAVSEEVRNAMKASQTE